VTAPTISSEGLLRLVDLVDRLRARDRGEEGVWWTTVERACPQISAVELWASMPEASRREALGALIALLERAVLLREFGGGKVQGRHRDRLAVVYVRQSSRQQVLEHTESTWMHYRLVERAVALGWAASRVLVIDGLCPEREGELDVGE
jgi:hypothetical protein